jgi:hypothetical protein
VIQAGLLYYAAADIEAMGRGFLGAQTEDEFPEEMHYK